MKKGYKKIYESGFIGKVKLSFFGWEWALYVFNELTPITRGKENYFGDAIHACNCAHENLEKILENWSPIKKDQDTSPE